jgi:hypothetical protein
MAVTVRCSIRNYAKSHKKVRWVELKVEYTTDSTRGNTKKNKPVVAQCG